jgi:hypothetical protein
VLLESGNGLKNGPGDRHVGRVVHEVGLRSGSTGWPSAWLSVALLALLATLPTAWAAEQVPAPLQVAIMVKVLVYDRTIATRSRDGLRVGVIFDPDRESSTKARDEFTKAFKETPRKIGDKIVLEIVEVPQGKLEAEAPTLDILYVADGANVAKVVEIAKKHRLITFASDRTAVEDGVVLGLVPRGDKPKLLINVGASVTSGMELDPSVLRLAELIRSPGG